MFSAAFFSHNRKKLLTSLPNVGCIILSANGLVQKSVDTTYPFRQDSNFWYLTGCNVPDAVLVMTAAESFIVLPERLQHRDQWEGVIDIEKISKMSGIDNVYTAKQGWEKIKKMLALQKKVGTILPGKSYEPHYGMYINPGKIAFARKVRRHTNGNTVDIRADLARIRQVKEDQEIEAIEKAVSITGESLTKLRLKINTMGNENDANVFLTHQFGLMGASGHGYDPIIASGRNAATIHYEQNNTPIVKNELLLLDVGAQYGMYSADISRTWAIGELTKRQKEIHAAVQDVHSFALQLVKPGMLLREYEKEVRSYMKQCLAGVGLIKKGDQKDHLHYYPHLTSHFLGVDVHDAGDYDAPLQPNTVITVEPGIYIAEEGIGVRIEDDVVITKSGYKNLSAHIPTGLVY